MNSQSINFAKLKLSINSLFIPMVVFLLAMVLTIGRAFNTDDLNGLHRFGLWLTVCSLVAVQVLVFMQLMYRYAFKSHAQGLLMSKVIAIILTILVVATQLHFLKYTPILPKRIDPPLEFLAFVWLPIAVISVIIILLNWVLSERPVNIAANDSDSVKVNKVSVDKADNVPEWRSSKTLRVQVEDHYLRIFNEHRQFFIRGKMSEAIDLLEDKEGTQVHRSHWVAFEYIDELQKEGRDYHLRLINGDQVPLSRRRVKEVRETLERFRANKH